MASSSCATPSSIVVGIGKTGAPEFTDGTATAPPAAANAATRDKIMGIIGFIISPDER